MGEKVYEEVFVFQCMRTTEKACHLLIDDVKHWVPFSVIEDNDEEIDEDFQGPLFIERWFCDKEGIEY